jgi:hypothetical protein
MACPDASRIFPVRDHHTVTEQIARQQVVAKPSLTVNFALGVFRSYGTILTYWSSRTFGAKAIFRTFAVVGDRGRAKLIRYVGKSIQFHTTLTRGLCTRTVRALVATGGGNSIADDARRSYDGSLKRRSCQNGLSHRYIRTDR